MTTTYNIHVQFTNVNDAIGGTGVASLDFNGSFTLNNNTNIIQNFFNSTNNNILLAPFAYDPAFPEPLPPGLTNNTYNPTTNALTVFLSNVNNDFASINNIPTPNAQIVIDANGVGVDYQVVLFDNLPLAFPNNAYNPFLAPIGNGILTITAGGSTAASNICFPANTPVTVDQGIIAIEKLDPSIHTINNKRIVAVTKTTSLKDYLVRLDKDSLGENVPSETTTISPEHKILYNGMLINAKYFIERFEHVYKVDYKGEFLYNVLMDDYSKMRVNNLTVETLHPDCDIAQRYNGNARSKKNSYIMKNMMNAVINNNVNNNNVVATNKGLTFRR
uniref:Hedgehog/Intein (Hint) domain-containing protein n=1 Tax=viral metagenome TaxID=1070528 RepID=A0A6C0HHI8_9ZZZZ